MKRYKTLLSYLLTGTVCIAIIAVILTGTSRAILQPHATVDIRYTAQPTVSYMLSLAKRTDIYNNCVAQSDLYHSSNPYPNQAKEKEAQDVVNALFYDLYTELQQQTTPSSTPTPINTTALPPITTVLHSFTASPSQGTIEVWQAILYFDQYDVSTQMPYYVRFFLDSESLEPYSILMEFDYSVYTGSEQQKTSGIQTFAKYLGITKPLQSSTVAMVNLLKHYDTYGIYPGLSSEQLLYDYYTPVKCWEFSRDGDTLYIVKYVSDIGTQLITLVHDDILPNPTTTRLIEENTD